MANSKYEYIRNFELPDPLLPNTYIVVRLDGRGFHKLCTRYDFAKPNDARALALMNQAATSCLRAMPDLCLAYGCSDEFSFLFPRTCMLFDRRASKLVSTLVSTFTAYYVHLWPTVFGQERRLEAELLPTFDGRAVMLPTEGGVRDYFAWRQVDCHINNLYNTTFWALVLRGDMGVAAAERKLAGTLAKDKNEILFQKFGINYNDEDEMFKKGTVVFRDYSGSVDTTAAAEPPIPPIDRPAESHGLLDDRPQEVSKTQIEKQRKARQKARITVQHVDLIRDRFWNERPWILSGATKVVPAPKEA